MPSFCCTDPGLETLLGRHGFLQDALDVMNPDDTNWRLRKLGKLTEIFSGLNLEERISFDAANTLLWFFECLLKGDDETGISQHLQLTLTKADASRPDKSVEAHPDFWKKLEKVLRHLDTKLAEYFRDLNENG